MKSIPGCGEDCTSFLEAGFGVSLAEGFPEELTLTGFPLLFCEDVLLSEDSFVSFFALLVSSLSRAFSNLKDNVTILSNSFSSRSANSCSLVITVWKIKYRNYGLLDTKAPWPGNCLSKALKVPVCCVDSVESMELVV